MSFLAAFLSTQDQSKAQAGLLLQWESQAFPGPAFPLLEREH